MHSARRGCYPHAGLVAKRPQRLTAEQSIDDGTLAELDGKQHQRFRGVDESFADEAIEISHVTHLRRVHRLYTQSTGWLVAVEFNAPLDTI